MAIKHVRKPAHLINIMFVTYVLIGWLILALHYEISNAKSFEEYPYGVSPRLYSNCESKWIGTPDNTRLAPLCKNVWGQLTRETLINNPY